MKTRLSLTAVAILFSVTVAFGQSSATKEISIAPVSRIDVGFNAINSFVDNFAEDSAGNFITGGGWIFVNSDSLNPSVTYPYQAAIAKFSPDGKLLWKKAWGGDSLSTSVQNQMAYDPQTNMVFAATYEGITATPTQIAGLSATGKQVWKITREPYSFYFLHAWKDLLAIKVGPNATVYEIDKANGVIKGSFQVGHASGDIGMSTIGDTLWIFANEFTGEYLLPAGKLIYKVPNTDFTTFPFIAYGTVDSDGNALVCASDPWDKIKGRTLFADAKISPDGKLLWKNSWYGWPADSIRLNLNNWVYGIALNKAQNLAVIYGSTQLAGTNGYDMNYCSAYLAFINVATGDTIMTEKWNDDQWADPTTTIWRAGFFDRGNHLVLLGVGYPGLSPYIKSHHFVKTFNVSILDGVTEPPHIPNAFALDQNYPNPFNPTTTIRYSIPRRDFVTLSVYNVLGQLVKTLVNGEVNAGTHRVSFDGSSLSSGVYISVLRAGNYVKTEKMMLLK